LVIAWLATLLATCVEDRLEDKAMGWVNEINAATDRAELNALLPRVEQWLSRSHYHLRAYLRADARLAEWEQLFDAEKLLPMTASEARAQEPMPPDSHHNIEARQRIRALCVAELARLSQSA
jgi:hypothetical protein